MNQKLKKGLKYTRNTLALSPVFLGYGLGLKYGVESFLFTPLEVPQSVERVVEIDETMRNISLESSLANSSNVLIDLKKEREAITSGLEYFADSTRFSNEFSESRNKILSMFALFGLSAFYGMAVGLILGTGKDHLYEM